MVLLGYPNGDPEMSNESLIAKYIGRRLGCITPFMLSRIIGLAEAYYLQDHGERLTGLKYVCALGTFYIEDFEEIISECFERNREKHCLEYKCGETTLPDNIRVYVDRAINDLIGKDLEEINRLVLENKYFQKLCGGVIQ